MKPRDRILKLLTLAGAHGLRGPEIVNICGFWSGTAYINLYRLERTGEIISDRDNNPEHAGARFYRLSEFK